MLKKKGSFALLEPVLLSEVSVRVAWVRLCFGGFSLHCGRRGGSLGRAVGTGAASVVAASAQADRVTFGASPSAC